MRRTVAPQQQVNCGLCPATPKAAAGGRQGDGQSMAQHG